ncbi:MAG: FAD-dependent oxidoreductase [Bryobacteraceae bacterium]|nr:FAD-dependent oxidoreductase [Bryobacteraceae bacterium]
MSGPSRREFGFAILGLLPRSEARIEGGFVFESETEGPDLGHRLRDRAAFPAPRSAKRTETLIIGGGVAGLSAAWRLHRRGYRDFAVLEMEKQPGGNARWGENEVSRFPWAAHYLPVPDPRQKLTRELCSELGLLDNGQWSERHLCHEPRERLYIHGRWQEGIEPAVGLGREDIRQFDAFHSIVGELRQTGAFRIPMEEGLARSTPAIRSLDQMTFSQWLDNHGFSSPYLRWYLDYCTRDDYGTPLDTISAWAGLHYFAAREPHELGPLTWPEGNGWIVQRLLERVGSHVHTGAMARQIRRAGGRWHVLAGNAEWEARFVIFAAPTWLASWIMDPPPARWPFEYAPWVVANLTLRRWPANRGLDYAWDNVFYNSPSLGYVIATHQSVKTFQPETVWTWYMALAPGRAADQRRLLLGGDYAWWKEAVLADLERVHPDIRHCVRRLDIFRIGHAMPRPAPGAIFHEERRRRAEPAGTLVFANSDLSALSLFEEALHRGVRAADHILRLASRAGA